MRTTILFLILAFTTIAFTVSGQQSKQKRYMFEEFTNGKVLMKNRGVVNTSLNYDWISQEINYMDGQEQMILTGLEMIDTVYIADRKLIPYGNQFLEVVPVDNGSLYINWKVKLKNKGKEGPMGTTSHAVTSQKADVMAMDKISSVPGQGLSISDIYVYDATFENTYYIRVDNKFKNFTSQKTFLKLFPKEKSEIVQSYIKEKKIDFQNTSDVIKLTNYTLALN